MSIILAVLMAAANGPVGPVTPVPAAPLSDRRQAPPPMTYDPHITEVGSCVWRNLRTEDKEKLLAAAETRSPFTLVATSIGLMSLDTYDPMRRCDPNFYRHPTASTVAMRAGLAEGIAETRLSKWKIDRKKLDAIWISDRSLREGMTSAFRDAQKAQLARNTGPKVHEIGDAMAERFTSLGKEALPRLGLRPSRPWEPGAPEFSAMSYWMARGWEVAIVEPLRIPPKAN